MSKEKQIEEMAMTICEQTDFVKIILNKSCSDGCSSENCIIKEHCKILYNSGYRKQSEGEWEIVKGSNGKEIMVCTNCRHSQDLHSTFTYCPNCGARMHGAHMRKEDEGK